MDVNLLKQYLKRLGDTNSDAEIDKILDEIVPLISKANISPPEIFMYFKTCGDEAIPKSQDHRNSISNSNKTQIILQKLMAKLSK